MLLLPPCYYRHALTSTLTPFRKKGGGGGEERSHVDLNYLKRFSKFQYLQSLSNFVALSAADFSIENSDVNAEHWL